MIVCTLINIDLCAVRLCFPVRGTTALHHAAYRGNTRVVKYLVEKCDAVITTQEENGTTPIMDAERQEYTSIVHYLKAQVLKMVMGIDINILPFYTGVRGIIAKYLQ